MINRASRAIDTTATHYYTVNTVTLVDTGGLIPDAKDDIDQGIARHVLAAIGEADIVVCVLDGTTLVIESDARVVSMLRKTGKPVVYVANKVDGPRQEQIANDIFTLGVPTLVHVSALHGRGIGELEAAVAERLPELGVSDEPQTQDNVTSITLIGRPNAGKSSLFNRISGAERSLVTSTPGTTRDPVDAVFEYNRQVYHVVDTAGIRRRSHIDKTSIEAVSVMRALRSMERADVAIVLCDALEGLAEQDARLIGLCIDKGRSVLVGINKSDLLEQANLKLMLEKCSATLHFAPWVPLRPISAHTGRGVKDLMSMARRIGEQFRRRVSTGELNRFMEQVLAKHAPPTQGGRAPRIYYITQVGTAPPTFVAMTNAPEHIKPSYERYIANQIRRHFGFEGTPLNIRFRGRGKPAK